MTAPAAPSEPPRARRPWVFWVGAPVATVVGLPAVCLALFALAHLGVGDPQQSWVRAAHMALVFAALPAFLTGGGVARMAARRAHGAQIGQVGPRVFRATIPPLVAAGAAWAYLVAVPLGGMPFSSARWAWVGVAGAVAGALTGACVALAVWQRLLYSNR